MKLLSVFVLIGESHGAVMSPNPAFMPKVTGFHKQLKPFVNPNPSPDYSNDPAFDPAFEDEDEDNENYNVADFLAGRIQTRRYLDSKFQRYQIFEKLRKSTLRPGIELKASCIVIFC